jgi:SnoaL-like polyketide cyclase
MTADVRLLDLWSRPPDDLPDPLAAFRAVYADPVTINGSAWPVADLVERARGLHAAFTEHAVEVVDRVAAPDKLVIAFRHTARHTGTWRTPLGELPPTGRAVSGLGIDVLTLDAEGRVSAIWVLADELQRILQVAPDRAR